MLEMESWNVKSITYLIWLLSTDYHENKNIILENHSQLIKSTDLSLPWFIIWFQPQKNTFFNGHLSAKVKGLKTQNAPLILLQYRQLIV